MKCSGERKWKDENREIWGVSEYLIAKKKKKKLDGEKGYLVGTNYKFGSWGKKRMSEMGEVI